MFAMRLAAPTRPLALRGLLTSLLVLALYAEAWAQSESKKQDEPLYRRVLTGADAKQVERLEQQIADLRLAGKFAEGCGPARAVADIRRRVQGEAHWETQDARHLVELLEKVATLPAEAQAELAAAGKQAKTAMGLYQSGRYREGVPLLRQVLEVRQRHLGPAHLEVARTLNDLAMQLHESGNPTAAESLNRRALVIFRKELGENHPHTATSYDNLAYNLYAQGKYAEADPLYRRALAIKQKVLGEGHPATASSYNNIAANLNEQSKYAEAESLFRRALAICQKLLGEDHPDTALSYNNVAYNLQAQGKYAEAEPLYRRALAIFQKVLGEDHPLTAHACNNVAYNLNAQSKYAEAEPLYRRALALRQKLLGEDHPDTASSYNNLAANLDAQGKYAEAEPLYRRALALRLKVLSEAHPLTALSYNTMAANLDAQGKYAEAEPLYRRALALRLKVLGEQHPATTTSYNNLALNLNDQGKYAEAERLFDRALAIRRKVLGQNHPLTALSYSNAAYNLDHLGKYAEAERLFREALAIYLTMLGEDHPDTVRNYSNLAHNLYAQGKFAEAEAGWLKAIRSFDVARLRSSATGLERASFAGARSPALALTACQARLGKTTLAWQSLEASLARGLLDDLTAPRAPEFTAEQRQRQQTVSATLARLDRQVPAVLRIQPQTEKEQARFRELAHERQAAQAELDRLAATLAARQVYDQKRLQPQLPADAAWVAWVDLKGWPTAADPNGEHWACVLRHQGDPVWVRLPGSGPGGAWTEDDDDLLDRFRLTVSALPGQARDDREALTRQVAAQRLAPLQPALRATGSLPAVKHVLVCPVWAMAGVPVEALTDQYTVSYVPSGTLFARLQEQRRAQGPAGAGATLFALGDPVFRQRPTDKVESLPEAGVLIAALVPGGNAERSGLKPHDVLLAYGDQKLSGPADLKPAPPGRDDEVAVQVWRHGQTLQRKVKPGPLGVRIAPQPAPVALRQRREASTALRASTGPYYPRLPGTRQEVQAIAGLFDRPLVLLDATANAQRLDALAQKDELRGFRYLHYATHGAVNPRVALHSALILARDPRPAGPGPTAADLPETDGQLTAAQMLQWKLDAELVTLSACQSGLGKQAGGEGYLGFAQALFLAGARSVVLSLWKVDDTATALLMARFYQNLLGKRPGLKEPLPKAAALREAKLWLRDLTATEVETLQADLRTGRLGAGPESPRDTEADAERPYAHPHYWAAFILIGDPQ
jgi:tetratricopeptide (TPR) repeat protein